MHDSFRKNKALFIVFEGIDGSGKSTQSLKLFNYLKEQGFTVFHGMEPTNGEYGSHIREILKGDEIPSAEKQVELFILDRKENIKNNVQPVLEKQGIVILDRYMYSNMAYQGAMGLSPEFILNKNLAENFPEPNRVYLIDITPETAINRITKRNSQGEQKNDFFEKASFLDKVRNIYLSNQRKNFCVINGDSDEETIFEEIKNDFSHII